MKSKDRKSEDKAKQLCFIKALDHIRKTTAFKKFTNIARHLSGQESGEQFDQMHNLISSIRYKRSTPPDFFAQQLYDTFPNEKLFEILSECFPISKDHQPEEAPIEEELPEMLLNRIRELKAEREGLKKQLHSIIIERMQLAEQLEEIINAQEIEDEELKSLVDFLRSGPFEA